MEADLWVGPAASAAGHFVGHQHGVEEGKQRIEAVTGVERRLRPFIEKCSRASGRTAGRAKVLACGFAFESAQGVEICCRRQGSQGCGQIVGATSAASFDAFASRPPRSSVRRS